MMTRPSLARNGQRAVQWQIPSKSRRCLASAASGSFSYETGDAGGVKFASRDLPGPTTHFAVVAKAGTRYQPLPGFSEGLEKFSFKVCFRCIDGLNVPKSTHHQTRKSDLADCLGCIITEHLEAFCLKDHERD